MNPQIQDRTHKTLCSGTFIKPAVSCLSLSIRVNVHDANPDTLVTLFGRCPVLVPRVTPTTLNDVFHGFPHLLPSRWPVLHPIRSGPPSYTRSKFIIHCNQITHLYKNTKEKLLRNCSLYSTVKPSRCTISPFILKWYTLHVSDGLSVHHQESNTVHTASGICHAGSGGYLTATRTCMIYAWCCMYSLRFLMLDGETARNM